MRKVILIVLVLAAAVWFGFGKTLIAKGKGAVGRSYEAHGAAADSSP